MTRAATKPAATSSSSTAATRRRIEYYRKAIALDPQLYSARSQLGVNLMRLGQDEEAYQPARDLLQQRFQRLRHRNSPAPAGYLKKYVTFTTPAPILKLDKKEADLLRPYFEAEMQRVIATYEKKYRFKLSSRCRWRSTPTTTISRCARWACPAWARWA